LFKHAHPLCAAIFAKALARVNGGRRIGEEGVALAPQVARRADPASR
jgi:hypothetical protein